MKAREAFDIVVAGLIAETGDRKYFPNISTKHEPNSDGVYDFKKTDYAPSIEAVRKALIQAEQDAKELQEIKGRANKVRNYVIGLESVLTTIDAIKDIYGNSPVGNLNQGAIELKNAINTVWEELKLHAYEPDPDKGFIDFLDTVSAHIEMPNDIISFILTGKEEGE